MKPKDEEMMEQMPMNEMDVTTKNAGLTPEMISEMIVDEEQCTPEIEKTNEAKFMDFMSKEINDAEDMFAKSIFELGDLAYKEKYSEMYDKRNECKLYEAKLNMANDMQKEFENLFVAA